MRKIRELLRLKFEQRLSDRKIAVVLSMSRSALGECLQRAAIAGVVWPLPEGLDDAELERRLYPSKPRPTEIPWPDFAHVHRELSRPGVTRQLLWQEYKAQHPDGLQYSAFCDRYRQWLAARRRARDALCAPRRREVLRRRLTPLAFCRTRSAGAQVPSAASV